MTYQELTLEVFRALLSSNPKHYPVDALAKDVKEVMGKLFPPPLPGTIIPV